MFSSVLMHSATKLVVHKHF